MRSDFCALILTHGRPDNVKTYATLLRQGYTGKVFMVCDDEDKTLPAYQKRYPNQVLTFSKQAIADKFDEADNFSDRRTVFYARNAAWELARQAGCRYFIQLDDDYPSFMYRRKWTNPELYRHKWSNRTNVTRVHQEQDTYTVKNLDGIFEALVRFLDCDPRISTIAMAQGGDIMGGFWFANPYEELFKRKAMNSFVCDTEKPFPFLGRLNEDVSTYVSLGRQGRLFLTTFSVQLAQVATQSNPGGMTDIYLDVGTYTKSFYTVMREPSCVKIATMGRYDKRIHHQISPNAALPKIMRAQP